jgi:hypothetical protein
MAGAKQVGRHREVAGQQGPAGGSAAPAHPLQIGEGMAKEEVAQPLAAPLGLRGQAGDQGAMDGAAQAPGQLGAPGVVAGIASLSLRPGKLGRGTDHL